MAATKTITNAWVNKTLPDIFYEEPQPPEDALVQERTVHRITHLLWERYEDWAGVFVSGMVYICYDIMDGNRRVQPDCFIAFEVDEEAIRRNLPNYWVWEVGKAPEFVIEVASPSTAANDLGSKRNLYARLGIAEYWRFDPTGGDLYGQTLAGERLVDGEYQEYELHTEEDGTVWARSELLGLDFSWDGDDFDVIDPETGKTIDKLEIEREARQADRLAFETREREHEVREREREAREHELLEEISRLRRQIAD